MIQARSKFVVSTNGLSFVNSFSLPFKPVLNLPLIGEIDLNKVIYGLCGGMCFAALDYYYAGQPVPSYSRTEDLPSNYILYLWDRQINSFGFLVVPKVIEWMLRDDGDVAVRTARYEVPKIRRALDQGQPVVLGLVRGKGPTDPTVNHQVLGSGYDFDETTRQFKVYLYDPNYPGLDSSLSMGLASPSQGLQGAQVTGEPFRGLFVIPYQAQQPPEEHHPD